MRLRPASAADAEAAAALVIAVDVAELGEADYSLGELRDEWADSGFELALDAVVAEDEAGTPIGYAHFRDSEVLAVVDPRREGEGAGAALLAWSERRGRERGLPTLGQAIGAGGARGRELLERAGYERVRSYWRMERDVGEGDTGAPAGFALRELALQDASALYAISEAAFSRNPDYEPRTEEAWTQRHLAAHGLDHALSRVAERAGEPVGFALVLRWEDSQVYVPLLAVRPDAAGHGLGGALLQAVFAAAAAAGRRQVRLNVASDNPNAIRLYERVGMTVRWRIDDYQRSL